MNEDKKQKSYIFPEEIKEKLSNFAKNKKAYIPNGGIYIIKREFIKKNISFFKIGRKKNNFKNKSSVKLLKKLTKIFVLHLFVKVLNEKLY